MTKRKVLITDDMHPVLAQKLTAAGYSCEVFPTISYQEILSVIQGYDGILINTRTIVDKAIIDQGKKLKFIARAGSGMEIVDVPYAQSKGIFCVNSPEGNRDSVAEQAVGMLLSLLHNINRADRQLRDHSWNREGNRGIELKGKTVGIIGYGNTGSAFAKRLKGFSCTVMAYDKYKSGFGDEDVEEVDINDIFESADIVSLHLPYTVETHFMVNDAFLSAFSKPIMLINTSRGKILKTEDLIDELSSKKVLGAALDVFENENKQEIESENDHLFEELIEMDNVILTPHIAGWTHESKMKLAAILADKIVALSIQKTA